MNDVLITIKSQQEVNGEKDSMEFTTVGQLDEKPNKTYLIYEESEIIGTPGAKTVIGFNDDSVSMQHIGKAGGKLIIENGKRHLCNYGTDFGNIQLGVFGESVEKIIVDDEIHINLSYTLDVNMSLMSRNQISILVKEVH